MLALRVTTRGVMSALRVTTRGVMSALRVTTRGVMSALRVTTRGVMSAMGAAGGRGASLDVALGDRHGAVRERCPPLRPR
jgi:hypothetical protein